MSKIEDAIVHLLKNDGTFYASLLSQMPRIEDKKTPTLHVEFKNGRASMHYNPEFIEPRNMKDTTSILEHECLHIVMDHFTRFKNTDHTVAKVATDLAINQLLTHLPSDALTVENTLGNDYKIRRNEKAEYYYDLIMKDEKMKQKIKDQFGDGGKGRDQCDGSCKPDPNSKDKKGNSNHTHGCGESFDDNGDSTDQQLQQEIVKQMVKEAVNTTKANQGHLPSQLESHLEELFRPPEVSWRTILRRLVANSVKSGHRPSWKKPSRRYGETQKGRVADRTVSIVVAIDTSGSINDEMLTDFIDEIKGIQACYKSDIHMIECDAKVQKYYKLKKHSKVDRNVQGRGGTDFQPVFKYVKEKRIKCDVLVFFTDLAGDFPDKKPQYPVIWGYYNYYDYGGSGAKAPFGHVITLKKEKKK